MDTKKFSIDGTGDKTIVGYSLGEYWNGFDVVYVDKDNFLQWLDTIKAGYKVNPDNSISVTFGTNEGINEFVDDSFNDIFPAENRPEWPFPVYSLSGYCFSENNNQ